MITDVSTVHLSNGRRLVPVEVGKRGKKIALRSRYDKALVEEFRCLKGAEWVPDEKVWTATDCRRNRMQLESIEGHTCPVCNGSGCLRCGRSGIAFVTPKELERYFLPVIPVEPRRPGAMAHQKSMLSHALTVRRDIWASEQGTGKTFAAIELMEHAAALGFTNWWYVAPLKVTKAVELEFAKWSCQVKPRLVHYDILHRSLEAHFQCRSCGEGDVPESKTWDKGEPDDGGIPTRAPGGRCRSCGSEAEHSSLWRRQPDPAAPHGVIFDESSFLKSGGTRRAEAAQHLANAVREEHDGFVVEMSGTPSPKDPTDWHSQAEIACPGFLRESSVVHLRRRLAIIEQGETAEGQAFPKVIGWKKDEVERLHHRLKGLVQIHLAKDCLDLPELRRDIIRLPISEEMKRAARLVAQSSINAVQALNRLRQLSDGFQYGGYSECKACAGAGSDSDGIDCTECQGAGFKAADAARAPCPKDDLLRQALGRNEETGRVVVYGGYHASLDRIVDVCIDEEWHVLRCDGRGWAAFFGKGRSANVPDREVGPMLQEMDAGTRTGTVERLAFVAHPGSGGYGLNLTAAVENVFYSNDFNGASRWQAEKRSHRTGQTRGVTITDFVHLPTDELVINNLEKKRTLQSVTLGEVVEALS